MEQGQVRTGTIAGPCCYAAGKSLTPRWSHQAETERRVLALVREHYRDYGPTLASEVLARDHDLTVNRETLRQWMSRERLWKPAGDTS